MKVLFCITRSDTVGGVQVHVSQMAAWLIRQGNEAVVMTGGEGVFCDELRSLGVPYVVSRRLGRDISVARDLAAIVEFRQKYKDFAPDIISLHSSKAGLIGRLASIGLGIPVLFTAHGWAFTEGIPAGRAKVFRTLERIMASLADRIITVSEFDRSLALRAGVGRPEQLIAVHNGMTDSELVANAGSENHPVVITSVARLDEQKDHRTLFLALSCLKRRDWVLNLVGDGSLRAALLDLAETLNLSENIRFLGFRRDVDEILAASHIFVLSTNWEGLPRSILEAMRTALPVIATDAGGSAETIEEGRSGFVVPVKDVETLADRLDRLIAEATERGRMGAAGRARYEQFFTFERMARENLKIYRELVDAS